eukprot:GHVU01044241.1.p1 GENE.GHVU01044241.1~~GHVU01044241.1.p1  ORF type:complete len:111 (+),score=4.24 GHVU01044241.1:334-666(+)
MILSLDNCAKCVTIAMQGSQSRIKRIIGKSQRQRAASQYKTREAAKHGTWEAAKSETKAATNMQKEQDTRERSSLYICKSTNRTVNEYMSCACCRRRTSLPERDNRSRNF